MPDNTLFPAGRLLAMPFFQAVFEIAACCAEHPLRVSSLFDWIVDYGWFKVDNVFIMS